MLIMRWSRIKTEKIDSLTDVIRHNVEPIHPWLQVDNLLVMLCFPTRIQWSLPVGRWLDDISMSPLSIRL
jgi:hypothetical protein